MKDEDKKNKHMTLEDRLTIWKMLEERSHTLKEIAEAVGKDPRAVAREVRIHRTLVSNAGRRASRPRASG